MTAAAPAVIVTTPAELAELVEAAVERVLERRGLSAANEPPTPSDWIDAREAARLLRVHVRTVSNYAAPGPDGAPPRLPSTNIGRIRRFRRADVIALLERGTEAHGG